MNEPVFPPLGTPGHHDRRSPPGSPAGLPIKWVSAPWHCAPAFQRVCLCQEHQLIRSFGPSVEDLENTIRGLRWLADISNGKGRSMDAVTLLRNDHKTVEGLFKKFEKAGPNAHKTKQDLVEKIIEELSVHAAIEEQVLYPAAREADPDDEDLVLESLEEHHIVKWVLSELDGMSPTDERFTAKVTVLIENVRHHVEEEEGDLFPALRKTMKRKELEELAQAMEKAKKAAPPHPHPRAPDTPPGNLVAGVAAGAVDRAQDTGKKTVRKILGRTRTRERKAG